MEGNMNNTCLSLKNYLCAHHYVMKCLNCRNSYFIDVFTQYIVLLRSELLLATFERENLSIMSYVYVEIIFSSKKKE